jgi:hypothetical protein
MVRSPCSTLAQKKLTAREQYAEAVKTVLHGLWMVLDIGACLSFCPGTCISCKAQFATVVVMDVVARHAQAWCCRHTLATCCITLMQRISGN